MAYGIWLVLGIEPTTDKKIIQQAYADKIKECHPEDDPKGFQLLQEAYREAIAYARTGAQKPLQRQIQQAVPKREAGEREDSRPETGEHGEHQPEYAEHESTQPDFETNEAETKKKLPKRIDFEKYQNRQNDEQEQNKPEIISEQEQNKPEIISEQEQKRSKIISEQVPDYIKSAHDEEEENYTEAELENYAVIIKEQLRLFTKKRDLSALDKLFSNEHFRNLMITDTFITFLEKKLTTLYMVDLTAIKYLLKRVEQLINDWPENEKLKSFRAVLRGKKRDTKVFLGVMLLPVFLVLIGFGVNLKTFDWFLYASAPSEEKVCEIMHKQYGVAIDVEDVQRKCVVNEDVISSRKYPKKVDYSVIYREDDDVISFEGEYLLHEDITWNWSEALVGYYLEKHLTCNYSCYDLEYSDIMSIDLDEWIIDEEGKKAFLREMEDMLEDMFSSKAVQNLGMNYQMDLSMTRLYHPDLKLDDWKISETDYQDVILRLDQAMTPLLDTAKEQYDLWVSMQDEDPAVMWEKLEEQYAPKLEEQYAPDLDEQLENIKNDIMMDWHEKNQDK